jgi:hypothetical protein
MPQDSIHRLNREEGTEPLRDRDRITEAIAAYMKEQERKKTSWIQRVIEVEPEIPMPAPPEPAAPQPAEAPSKEPEPQTLNTIVEQGDSTRRRSTLDPR